MWRWANVCHLRRKACFPEHGEKTIACCVVMDTMVDIIKAGFGQNEGDFFLSIITPAFHPWLNISAFICKAFQSSCEGENTMEKRSAKTLKQKIPKHKMISLIERHLFRHFRPVRATKATLCFTPK